MAVRGLKPVVEIQFFDYIWPGDAPDAQRTSADAMAIEWGVQLPAGDACSDRWIPDQGGSIYHFPKPGEKASLRIRLGCGL